MPKINLIAEKDVPKTTAGRKTGMWTTILQQLKDAAPGKCLKIEFEPGEVKDFNKAKAVIANTGRRLEIPVTVTTDPATNTIYLTRKPAK